MAPPQTQFLPAKPKEHGTDLWHDATSSFDTAEDADQRHIDAIIGGLHVPSSAGPHVPCPPLLMAEREYVFVPVPEKVS